MRRTLSLVALAAFGATATACYEDVLAPGELPAPTGLFYQLEPSGDPTEPLGVVLRWTDLDEPELDVYNVYSRGSTSEDFGLRGTTTSPSFHDDGPPHLEYFVTAVSLDGVESEESNIVLIDEALRLPRPLALSSVSLDRMIHLDWSDNAFQADPAGFAAYRIYSTSYDLDANECGTSWVLEGSSVANTFLVGAMANGVPRCFAVSAITIEGFESLWSDLRYDTPRPDGRNVIIFTAAADAARSGFRFFFDANGDGQASALELGLVGNASAGTFDFTLNDVGGTLYLTPQRLPSTITQYGTGPIADLTSINVAPIGPYTRTALQAREQFGYVFEFDEGGPFPFYGAIRVTATGSNYAIFDWSYQTDPGNPEMIVRGRP